MRQDREHRGSNRTYMLMLHLVTTMVATAILGVFPAAEAFNSQSFFGGMLAGRAVTRFGEERKQKEEMQKQELQAMQYSAYGNPRGAQEYGYRPPMPQAQPMTPQAPAASAPQMTVQQKLAELDKLAAGGYITPQEYKARRQAILNSL